MANSIQRVTERMQSRHLAQLAADHGAPAQVAINKATRAITWSVAGRVVALTQYGKEWAIACYIDHGATA